MTGRVMFYAQHLLGIGHLKRAAILARAMAAHGLEVWVVLGGPAVPGVAFDGCARIALPPIRAADASFQSLVDEHGAPIDDAIKEARLSRLLYEFATVRPDVLLIEQFPFGRNAFRFELMPLLARARVATPAPTVVCSLRDVLVRKSDPARRREMVTLAKAWFHRILVHGDPTLIPLEASFPEARDLADMLRYTGYATEPRPNPAPPIFESGRGEVIVSAGGGAVGEPLLRCALAARPLSRAATLPWRLVCGPGLADPVYGELLFDPPPGVIVERWRADLPNLLRNCVLSISQGGYNTIVDILQVAVPAVVVPFADGNETEQALRAAILAGKGVMTVVDPARLSPQSLAAAVDATLGKPPTTIPVNLDGAAATAREIAALCRGRGA
ncbi:MAG: glycosyl transferase family 28 [Rhodospirillales bacterium]|nr:MAG: glycosyl transferase family 28 [Rhodospirillales bacterium]